MAPTILGSQCNSLQCPSTVSFVPLHVEMFHFALPSGIFFWCIHKKFTIGDRIFNNIPKKHSNKFLFTE